MSLKKVTIVILPDGVNTVKQIKIPKLFLGFLLTFIFAVTAFLAWGSVDYYRIKSQVPEQARLLEENQQKEAQLVALTSKIDKINLQPTSTSTSTPTVNKAQNMGITFTGSAQGYSLW